MRKLGTVIVFISLFALALSACGGKATDPAAKAVENYLNALVSKDASKLSALSCADWEPTALMELDSLQAVTASLDKVSCKTASTNGTNSEVQCQGNILYTYDNENQTLDLSAQPYQVVQQGGEYLVCGYSTK